LENNTSAHLTIACIVGAHFMEAAAYLARNIISQEGDNNIKNNIGHWMKPLSNLNFVRAIAAMAELLLMGCNE
jgi:hypothetical protein